MLASQVPAGATLVAPAVALAVAALATAVLVLRCRQLFGDFALREIATSS